MSSGFVTEKELSEQKKARQEEWERVRKPDDPEEAPEVAYDPRSLFEQLEEHRVKKQDEWDESHKLKNQIRGLGMLQVWNINKLRRVIPFWFIEVNYIFNLILLHFR